VCFSFPEMQAEIAIQLHQPIFETNKNIPEKGFG
jgi:hypothetical protein